MDGGWGQVRKEKVNSTVYMMVWMPQNLTDQPVSQFITKPNVFIFSLIDYSIVQAICLQKQVNTESLKINEFSSGTLQSVSIIWYFIFYGTDSYVQVIATFKSRWSTYQILLLSQWLKHIVNILLAPMNFKTLFLMYKSVYIMVC